MRLSFLFLGVILALIQTYGSQQIQMPESSAFSTSDMNDVSEQLDRLKHNVSELWENFSALKTALTETLNHLRVHQVELEETVHMLEHKHDTGSGDHHHGSYTDDHHHHSGEHGDSHSHGESSHSHGDDSHSHGDDGQHRHSGEQHSHGGDDHYHGDSHSHSEEHHSHSGEHQHESSSHSHSHSHGGSGHGSDSHHHHNGDSHEKTDDLQQVSQGSGHSVIEPMVMPTTSQQHYHHHQQPHMGLSNNLQLINDNSFNRHHHHHHHRSHGKTERNRTVVIPKYSEVGEYDFAICNVQPNRGLPQDQQQEINGRINLWQKKTGGPLNIHLRLQGFDMGGDHAHHGAHQALQHEETNETPVTIGHKHGFHVHSLGDLSNGCQSTGPHYNPKNVNHGGPNSLVRHIGDLGNIECDDHGNANIVFNDEIASLKGQYSIIGKSLVIHANQDDYGLGGDEESLRTGNAGTRLACCIIEKVDKLPIRSYKFIKTATQYLN